MALAGALMLSPRLARRHAGMGGLQGLIVRLWLVCTTCRQALLRVFGRQSPDGVIQSVTAEKVLPPVCSKTRLWAPQSPGRPL
ncbi:hypothetical protein GCM10012282_46040 [Streptomyces lacrimifluminis]|uniref:Uncharacterized protein n=1 Tax=Streptomyces lacrimifluminis TaxID=1500077 RepID=A0A917L4G4_9ACTN|nr:hypothetical protein GCM10012282_46040 [Streptomyces lacrimifluminis]